MEAPRNDQNVRGKGKEKITHSEVGSNAVLADNDNDYEDDAYSTIVRKYKKPLTHEQIAFMMVTDPVRANRILRNRRSAVRAKQRKVHYMLELENKVKTLLSEKARLIAQLSSMEEETKDMVEKNETLKLQLRAAVRRDWLHDSWNEAMDQHIQRLKAATGELMETPQYSSMTSSNAPPQVLPIQSPPPMSDSSSEQDPHAWFWGH